MGDLRKRPVDRSAQPGISDCRQRGRGSGKEREGGEIERLGEGGSLTRSTSAFAASWRCGC